MPAFGFVEQSRMNEYAAPYTPSMPFFTVPAVSEPTYAYPISSPEPYSYSYPGYSAPCYVSYCPDYPSSNSPQVINPDWYVGCPIPPTASQQDWYSENEDPAISSYYPDAAAAAAAAPFDDGFYGYGSCPYSSSQVHVGDPALASSTVITTSPWENFPPASTAAAPITTDFYGSFQAASSDFDGGERKEDAQIQKPQKKDNATSSEGTRLKHFEEQQTGKTADSSQRFKQVSSSWHENVSMTGGMEHSRTMPTCLNSEAGKLPECSEGFNFKQGNSSCEEIASTYVGMGNSHTMPNCFDFEGFSTVSQKDFEANVQGPSYKQLQQSIDLLEPAFGWFGSYPADISVPRTNCSVSKPIGSASDVVKAAVKNWVPSYPADTSVPRMNFSVSKPTDSALVSLEKYSLSPLFDCHKYESPMLLSPQSIKERAPIGLQKSKGKVQAAIDIDSNMENIGNSHFVSEGIGKRNQEVSAVCSIKTKKPIHSPANTEQASHLLNFKLKPLSSTNPRHCNDPSNRVCESLDVSLMKDMSPNHLSSFQEMDFHSKRLEDFLIDSSKDGDDPVLITKACGPRGYPTQNVSAKRLEDILADSSKGGDDPLLDTKSDGLRTYPTQNFSAKRLEGFLTIASKGGDDPLLVMKSDGLGSYPTQNASGAGSHGQFSHILDILSSDCHPPNKPSRLFPMSRSESASSFSTLQSVKGSARHGDLGSQLSSLINTAPTISAAQFFNEFKGGEETKSCQSSPLHIGKTASVECTQVSVGTASSLSEDTRQRNDRSSSSLEFVGFGECDELVYTMHNLSLLLASSPSLDNLRESDLQVLKSVICNLSQCLVKRMGFSTSTVETAIKPEEPVVTANVEMTQKGCKLDRCCSKVDGIVDFPRHKSMASIACSAVGGKEVPVEKTNIFQVSSEAVQSQMVNFQADLDLMKLEIRCLRMEIEMERLRKSHKSELQFGNSQTSANKTAINSGNCPKEENLGIKGNEFDHTAVPVSQERCHELPDLNLNLVMDSAIQTDETFIKHGSMLLSQNKSHGESILNCSLSTSDQNMQQPNVKIGSEQIEGSKLNIGCTSGSDDGKVKCTNCSSLPESNDSSQLNSQHKLPSVTEMILEITPHSGCDLKSSNHAHSLERSIMCNSSPAVSSCMNIEKESPLEDQKSVSFAKHAETEILNPNNSKFFTGIKGQTSNIFLKGGATVDATVECLTESNSATCCHDLENVDAVHTLKEYSSSESDAGWEQIDKNEEDDIYSSAEDSVFLF